MPCDPGSSVFLRQKPRGALLSPVSCSSCQTPATPPASCSTNTNTATAFLHPDNASSTTPRPSCCTDSTSAAPSPFSCRTLGRTTVRPHLSCSYTTRPGNDAPLLRYTCLITPPVPSSSLRYSSLLHLHQRHGTPLLTSCSSLPLGHTISRSVLPLSQCQSPPHNITTPNTHFNCLSKNNLKFFYHSERISSSDNILIMKG